MRTKGPAARTLSTADAAAMLGVSRGTLWAAARDEGFIVVGQEVVRPIRVGARLAWPTAPIERGLDQSDPGPADLSAEDTARDNASAAAG
jgi:hypothetical protein